MKIALISSGYLPVLDGVTVSVHERVMRLAARGHRVLLLAPRPGPALGGIGALPEGVEHVALASAPFGGAHGDRNAVRAAHGEIETALAAFRPDVIHVDEPERLALGLKRIPARAYARRHGVPSIAFFHTNFVDYAVGDGALRPLGAIGWRAVARLYALYDATLVPSAETHRRLESFGLRTGVCGRFNGADTSLFTPALRQPGYWAREWGLPETDGRFVLLVVGRLTADKGWRFWEGALPALGRRLGDRLAVVVAGEGALRPRVAQLLATAVPQGHLLGAVPRARMPGLLANADLYATASRHENASLAVYEAQASGTPVIAPRAGGLPDQIADGRTGLLFEPADLKGFVAAVARVAEHAAVRAELREALVAHRNSIGWDAAVAAWLEAVEGIVARNRRVA